MNPPKVIVSILNWNGVDFTTTAVQSVLNSPYPALEVIVLDNGSTMNEAHQLQTTFSHPQVTIIRSERNLGFAGGHNYVIQQLAPSDYEYCLLLNQDAELHPDAIKQLVATMSSNTNTAVAGPVVLEADRNTIQSAGGEFSLITGKATSYHRGTLLHNLETSAMRTQVSCIMGSCLMMRKSVIDAIGLFDETYFAYYEEIDWCLRATQSGYTCRVVPRARVVHSQPGGFRPYYIARNMVWFVKKFSSWHQLLQFALYYWMVFIPERIKKGANIRALLRGATHGWLGKNKGKSSTYS